MRENTNRCKNSHFLAGKGIIYGSTKVLASKVTNDTVANVQPIFLFKPVGMAKEDINNAFLSMSSFRLLSVAMRLLRLDTESVVELERQIAVFVIVASALTVLPGHIVGILRIPRQPSGFLLFCFM